MTNFCQTCGGQKGLHFSTLPGYTCTTAAPFYYPIQPKREWAGLTDEEVSEVIDNVLEGGGWLDVARALEAAIKEKNYER